MAHRQAIAGPGPQIRGGNDVRLQLIGELGLYIIEQKQGWERAVEGRGEGAHRQAVAGPAPLVGGGVDVGLQLICQLGQVQEKVSRGAQNGGGAGLLAAGVYELRRVEHGSTVVALITFGILQRNSD